MILTQEQQAILNGEKALRSSVILVQPYTGSGAKEMDAGPVIGISEPLPIDTGGLTLEELAAMRSARQPGVKVCDRLRQLALEHIELLKVAGDHVVFPRAAAEFASGVFAEEGNEKRGVCACEVAYCKYAVGGELFVGRTADI